MARVEIFYAQMCGLCHEAMDYFRQNGIEFDSYEVKWGGEEFEDSENTRRMYELCGEKVDFVPQIFIDGKHIPGWRKLSELIESGEFQEMMKDQEIMSGILRFHQRYLNHQPNLSSRSFQKSRNSGQQLCSTNGE